MKKILIGIFAILCMQSVFFSAHAFLIDEEDDALILYVGDIKILPVVGPSRIAVGKPDVADVIEASQTEIRLAAKAKGETTIVWWDTFGEHSFPVRVFQEDMGRIKKHMEKLMAEFDISGITLKPMDSENKVFMFGHLKKEKKDKLMSLLAAYGDKMVDFITVKEEEMLIEITAEVIDVISDASREMGFTFPRSLSIAESAVPGAGYSFSTFMKSGPYERANNFAWTLKLLEDQNKARILSRPRVVCQSGRTAELTIGGEVPIFNTSIAAISGGAGTQIEYKTYGITFTISPTVNKNGKVQLSLSISVSEPGEAQTIGSSSSPTAKAYPMTKRSITTQLAMNDGETLVVGGLISKNTTNNLSKFPWLADVPVLGMFFRNRTDKVLADRELFVALTPRVITLKTPDVVDDPEPFTVKTSAQPSTAIPLNVPGTLQAYTADVQKKIQENLVYPKELLDTGWQGNVTLKLVIDQLGTLKDVYIMHPSGYTIFDEQAIATARQLVYAPFPPDVALKELRVEVPIVFRQQKHND